MTGISEVADRAIRHLSLGMKQRLGIAVALLHDPPILILDEPTNGLDPVGIVATRQQLKRLSQEFGKTIVISSHLLGEIEKTATRIGIIHRGSMRFEGTSEELSELLGATSELRVRVSSTEAALRALKDAGLSGRAEGLSIMIDAGSDAAAAAALKAISSRGVEIYESAREARSLERDFLSLTGGDDDVQ
jgi:ABC-2 type transport system ATP-binding protein